MHQQSFKPVSLIFMLRSYLTGGLVVPETFCERREHQQTTSSVIHIQVG